MLNCFKDYKRCINISYHTLDCIRQKKTKFTMDQPYTLPILFCQYHVCWRPDDLRSQCINKHGVDPQSRNIPSPASYELTLTTAFVNDLVQDCSNSSALAMELLQSCNKRSMCSWINNSTGRELRSGVKCIVLTIVTGSLWLVWRYRWNCIEIHLASTIPSH